MLTAFAPPLLQGAPQGGANPYGTIFMFVALFAILYFLIIRPQRQQQKAHDKLVRELAKGDQVVTLGGIVGRIIRIDEERLTLKTAGDTRIEVERSKVGRRLSPAAGSGEKE